MLPDEMMQRYFDRMIGRIYKILPLKESGEATLPSYLDGLLSEMLGVEIITSLAQQPYYVSIVATMAYLSQNIEKCDKTKVKRDVFSTISLCQKLRDEYKGGVGNELEP